MRLGAHPELWATVLEPQGAVCSQSLRSKVTDRLWHTVFVLTEGRLLGSVKGRFISIAGASRATAADLCAVWGFWVQPASSHQSIAGWLAP